MTFKRGEEVRVDRMGKCRLGHVSRDQVAAGAPVYYRCTFNGGEHTVLASRVHRIRKRRVHGTSQTLDSD